jgi:hypothetical protein
MMANDSDAMAAIRAERQRQIDVEGWSADHDDRHDDGSMIEAAEIYYRHGKLGHLNVPLRGWDGAPYGWPWDADWWKPKDPRRDLERAGALCLAEIDHLRRRIAAIESGLLKEIEVELAIHMGPDLVKTIGSDAAAQGD